MHHDDNLTPFYVIDIDGTTRDTVGSCMKVPPKFVFNCGDEVFVALNSSKELQHAVVSSIQGDRLAPTLYRLVYDDSLGMEGGPVNPNRLYPGLLNGKRQDEAVAVNYLIKRFPHLREQARKSATDDNVNTAVQTEPTPVAVQGQVNLTDNQDSELMEQSTDQQGSDEDNSNKRHPSHQVPNNMSAEDSSDVPPSEEVQGQGDGAENAGSDHNPD